MDGQPLRFKAAFEVVPEIDVSGYDVVRVAKPDAALTDEEYEAELNRVLESHATVEPVEEDRPLADGDWAEIQFTRRDQGAGADSDRRGRSSRLRSRSRSPARTC